MNIPCNLHNEHVNKLFKEMISNIGANFTEAVSTRAAQAVTSLQEHNNYAVVTGTNTH